MNNFASLFVNEEKIMIKNILLVASGGAVGSVLRYLVSKWLQEASSAAFPVGTLVVNVVGCLLIGAIYGASDRWGISGDMRLLLTVGFCGGFTTFSTFMNESLSLMRADNLLPLALYASLSVGLGLVAVWAGSRI